MVTTRIARVCRLLNKEKARYLVAGGEACILHGLIRTTEDIDIFIAKDKKNVERVLTALENLLWGIAKEIDPEKLLRDPVTIIGDQPRVDVFTILPGITFSSAWQSRQRIVFEGVLIPYLSLAHLIRTKKTDRLQDLADLEKLKRLRGK